MADTNFAITLQGVTLSDDAKARIEAGLRSTVLSEVAKIDHGNQFQVEPLGSGERMSGLISALGPIILGFILRPGRPMVNRSTGEGSGTGTSMVPASGVSVEALEYLYLRPDVRAAVVSNTRAFSELLSRDPDAYKVFNELAGGPTDRSDTERIAPLVFAAWAAGAFIAGGLVGWASRK